MNAYPEFIRRKVVKAIYRLYLDGLGVHEIVVRLKFEKIVFDLEDDEINEIIDYYNCIYL
jgi:hypothetical protein